MFIWTQSIWLHFENLIFIPIVTPLSVPSPDWVHIAFARWTTNLPGHGMRSVYFHWPLILTSLTLMLNGIKGTACPQKCMYHSSKSCIPWCNKTLSPSCFNLITPCNTCHSGYCILINNSKIVHILNTCWGMKIKRGWENSVDGYCLLLKKKMSLIKSDTRRRVP